MRGRGCRRGERGLATAELAVALPAVVLVLALCLTAMTLGVDLVRCEDAARAGARAASRGEAVTLVREVVASRAPAGSTVEVDAEAETVTVRVSAPGRVRLLPALPGARASAAALWEPGARP
ncbi:TadE family type IV pilus minor pilin [Ornithinimicrobium avium]|uniref:TadE family type IV pilus minor pilin n=1 Tax=Ornithinimicrobium avium TaxID=2283195 RepID=UPI001D17DB29|nr:TadE family type IV pilus minor pilin [Ornithinimicrobium avium]